MQGYASGFLPTPPHDDAVASGSELAPPLPPGDFHPQSIAHAGRTQGATFGGVRSTTATTSLSHRPDPRYCARPHGRARSRPGRLAQIPLVRGARLVLRRESCPLSALPHDVGPAQSDRSTVEHVAHVGVPALDEGPAACNHGCRGESPAEAVSEPGQDKARSDAVWPDGRDDVSGPIRPLAAP